VGARKSLRRRQGDLPILLAAAPWAVSLAEDSTAAMLRWMSQLVIKAAEEKVKPMFCPACGRQVPDDSAFCPSCGGDMSAARQLTRQMAPVTTQPGPQAPPFPQRMPPTGPGLPGAYPPPRKSNVGLVVGLSAGGVVMLLLFVVGGIFAFRAFTSAKPPVLSASTSTSAGAVGSPTSAPKGASTPETAVDAWFAAVASGDIAAVKRTATSDFAAAIEPGMFEGRDPNTSYRVVSTQTTGDTATADVQESPSNAPAQTTTTLTLARQTDGTWLVAGYAVTATGQTVGTTPPAATPSAPPVVPTAPVFSKTDAIDAVGTMLSGLNGKGSLSAAKAAATSRFKNANPGWIMRTSDFDFYVTGATRKGDAWIVKTKEQWVSGDETGTYTVVVKSGKGYVDRRNGLN
jgi:hypothetical protein